MAEWVRVSTPAGHFTVTRTVFEKSSGWRELTGDALDARGRPLPPKYREDVGEPPPARKTAAKKATAKKSTSKTAATKTAAKKAPARKAPAKKTVTAQSSAKATVTAAQNTATNATQAVTEAAQKVGD